MITRRVSIIVFILCFILPALTPGAAHAQSGPAWRQNLDCDPAEQKYRGVEFCRGKNPYPNTYVIVVDLSDSDVKIEYVIAEGYDKNGQLGECRDVNRASKGLGGVGCDAADNRMYYPVMQLDQAVQRYINQGQAALINADYSACTVSLANCGQEYREHGPEGYTVVRGKRRDGKINGDGDNNAVYRPFLALSSGPGIPAKIASLKQDDEGGWEWVYTGVGGGPWLVKDGQKVDYGDNTPCNSDDPKDSIYPNACRDGADQTAVATSADSRWLFLIAMRNVDKYQLILSNFLLDVLEADDAIKMDGGGSTQLWYAGAVQPYILQGDGRLLTNYLSVLAAPGSGIDYFQPVPNPEPFPELPEIPEIPPLDPQSWLDKLEAWWHGTELYQTIQEIQQTIAQVKQAIADFEQFVQNIQDPNWWNSLKCLEGMAAVLALAAFALRLSRRR